MKHDTFIILHHTLVMFRKMFFHFVGVEFQHLGALDGRKPTSKEEELRSSWDLMASYGSSRSECLGCHGMACVACVMSCLPLLKFSSTEVEHGQSTQHSNPVDQGVFHCSCNHLVLTCLGHIQWLLCCVGVAKEMSIGCRQSARDVARHERLWLERFNAWFLKICAMQFFVDSLLLKYLDLIPYFYTVL